MKIAAPAAAVAALALLAVVPVSAAAQSWTYPDQVRSWSSYSRYGHDFQGQRDRPGDYRCDAYWDRGRDDCDARWRDQRPFARTYASDPRYDRHRHSSRYDDGYGYGYGSRPEGQVWHGAYGRPDLVYPASRHGDHLSQGRRQGQGRAAWCSARYRSYDPASGYYRAYSGRLVFCG